MSVYYVTQAAAGGGAGTSGDPYTIAEAADNVIAGDKVWIQADASYIAQDGASSAIMELTVVGTLVAPIELEGYTTTIGDGGIATLDATSGGYNSAITSTLDNPFYIIKNIRCTGGATDGFYGSVFDASIFINCQFDNNDGDGCFVDNNCTFINCTFHTNGAIGCDPDNTTTYIGCKAYTNTSYGLNANSGLTAAWCISYDNLVQIRSNGSGIMLSNTVDGDDVASTVGLLWDGIASNPEIAINNIAMDCVEGFRDDTNSGNTYDSGSLNYANYNMGVSNTTDFTGSQFTDYGANDIDTATDPFEDSASRDYTLASGSEALNSGTDGSDV